MTDHHHHAHGADHDDADGMAELLDLDADVLHAYLLDATAWVHQWAPDAPRRILDLGAGTGAGTIALAQRFPTADVIAVDQSADLLARVLAKARDLGLAGRVDTVQADLDGPWPAVDPVDVVWASLSMHHLADPDRVLADVLATLRPGGVLAVVEMDTSPRFLPDDLGVGRPGLEARCQAAVDEERATELPNLGSDWGPRLESAGFTRIEHRTFTVDPAPPYPAATGRYAQAYLKRIRAAVEDRLDADDLATLDLLLAADGPHSVVTRSDVAVRGTRTGWIAGRA